MSVGDAASGAASELSCSAALDKPKSQEMLRCGDSIFKRGSKLPFCGLIQTSLRALDGGFFKVKSQFLNGLNVRRDHC